MSLEKLPIEVLTEIGKYCSRSKDLVHFMLTCRTTRDALVSASGVWRHRYCEEYDADTTIKNSDMHDMYCEVEKRQLLTGCTIYDRYHSTREDYLRATTKGFIILIKEAFAGVREGEKSKNISKLEYLTRNIARRIFDPDLKDTNIKTIQLVMFHVGLRIESPTRNFCLSQRFAYANPNERPLWDINTGKLMINELLNLANFWKHYFCTDTDVIREYFRKLPLKERPRAWDAKLGPGAKKLGKNWKGCHAYLRDFRDVKACRMRRNTNERPIHDMIDPNSDDGFHTMSLEFEESVQPSWTPEIDYFVSGLPSPQLTYRLHRGMSSQQEIPGDVKFEEDAVKGKDYVQFVGQSRITDPFLLAGVVHPLPEQRGIPGWQRVSIIAYPRNAACQRTAPPPRSTPVPEGLKKSVHYPPPDLDSIDLEEDGSWAYEGIALPGGKIILGRWFAPYEEELDVPDKRRSAIYQVRTCGPFVFWNVDE